jgi:hypothetical protein
MMEKAREVIPVAMFTDEHYDAGVTMDVDQRQKSSMPEDEDDRRTLLPEPHQVVVPRPLDVQSPKEGP